MRKNLYFKKVLILVFGLLLLFNSLTFSQDLNVRAFVDRTAVPVGQVFVLTIELSGPGANSAPRPQLPDLSAFAEFAGGGSMQSQQIVGNKVSVSIQFINNFITRTEGKFEIPSITVNYAGKAYSTQPISIEVVKASARPKQPSQRPRQPSTQRGIQPENAIEGNLFLKAEIDRRSVYKNQPVVVTYKIYTRVEIVSYALSKMPELVGFWSEDFTMPQQPVTYEEVIEGKKFLVAEIWKSALYPTESGEKTIEPFEIVCDVRLQSRTSSRDVFDRFFNDDFFRSNVFGRRERVTVSSDPVKINVKPLPQAEVPGDFSGLVGKFDMKATLDKEQVEANEAVSLKVRFSGEGNIKMIPEPKVTFPKELESYEPKVEQSINRSGRSLRGNKTYEYVLVPRYAGEFRIKPFAFSYFDSGEGAYKTLRSPEFLVKVGAGSGARAPQPSGLSRQEIQLIGRDIRFIKQTGEKFHRIGEYFYKKFWFGLLLFVPLLAMGWAVVVRQRQNKMIENVAYARSRRANQMAKKRLSRAYKLMHPESEKEFYAEISQALLGFIADKLNLSAAGLISDEVAEKLKERGVEDSVISELLSCLQECDYRRFAPAGTGSEDMKALYERAGGAIVSLEKARLA